MGKNENEALAEKFQHVDAEGNLLSECQRLKEARLAYNLLQKNVRTQMKKLGLARVPQELVKGVEREILAHFCDHSNVDFEVPLIKLNLSSYDRSWVHRICNYYGLRSLSEVEASPKAT